MYRVFGLIMVVAGCSGYGLCLVSREKLRCSQLREVIHILHRFECEIRNGKRTIEDICFLLSSSEPEEYGRFFRKVYNLRRKMPGASFQYIWDEEMRNDMERLVLRKEEMDVIYDLPGKILQTNKELQLLEMIQICNYLEERLACANKELKERGKVIMSMSVLTGIFLVIVLF